MGIIREFKEFALRGNVMDLAVGVIIGGAFGKIVSSLVNDVIMPPLGKLMGEVNFTDRFLILNPWQVGTVTSVAQARHDGVPIIAYGSFLTAVLDFFIVAICVFVMLKILNTLARGRLHKTTTRECPYCVSSIPVKAVRCAHCTADLLPKGNSDGFTRAA
jgi:large conductance mechanosensitive channel